MFTCTECNAQLLTQKGYDQHREARCGYQARRRVRRRQHDMSKIAARVALADENLKDEIQLTSTDASCWITATFSSDLFGWELMCGVGHEMVDAHRGMVWTAAEERRDLVKPGTPVRVKAPLFPVDARAAFGDSWRDEHFYGKCINVAGRRDGQ